MESQGLDFEKEVIQRSAEKPVVVDFWAPWCGPCKFLGPVIEGLAEEASGSWELVKVNSDENADLSATYKIRGIPAVKMFHHGEVIAEFTGAMPRHQIERWLQKNLPDPRRESLRIILSKIDGGESLSEGGLNEFVENHPDFIEAKVELATRLALEDPQKAWLLVSAIKPGESHFERVQGIKYLNDLMSGPVNRNGQSGLAEFTDSLRAEISRQDYDQLLQQLIEGLSKYPEAKDTIRRATLGVFEILGSGHELTRKFRKRFDMALY